MMGRGISAPKIPPAARVTAHLILIGVTKNISVCHLQVLVFGLHVQCFIVTNGLVIIKVFLVVKILLYLSAAMDANGMKTQKYIM